MMTRLQQMPSDAEEVLDEPVHGQKSLRTTRRFEPSHLPLSLPRRLVGDLGSGVRVLVGAVYDGRHDLAASGAVASQLVGDQPPGLAALRFQQLSEEAFSGSPITARLDENVEHVAILIHGTPTILAAALDRDEDLVQVPCVTETALATLQPATVFRTELDAPKSDRFIGHRDAALSEHVFHVSKAHAESVVEPNGMTDDFCWNRYPP